MVKLNGYAMVLGAAVFGGAMPAMAADECGPVVTTANADPITCSVDNYAGGDVFPNFPTGIEYSNFNGQTLILDDAALTISGGVQLSSSFSSSGIGDISVIGTNVGTITVETDNIEGVFVRNLGLGAALVQIDGGAVTTSGKNSEGLFAAVASLTSEATATVRLTAGDIVTAGRNANGIFAITLGTGLATTTVSGVSTVTASGVAANGIRTTVSQVDATYAVAVSDTAVVTGGSGTGAGIHTASVAGSAGTIAIAAGATVDGTTNGALGIVDDAGAVTVAVAGTVTGDIRLGRGSDTLRIASTADITGVTVLDGGDDVSIADNSVDKLTLSGQELSFEGADLTNWEILIVRGGSLAITDEALTVGSGTLIVTNAAIFDAGTNLDLTGNLIAVAGGKFDSTGAGMGAYRVNGLVINDGGIIAMQDNFAGDRLTVTGNYNTRGGTLLVDVDLATDAADMLVVRGDVTGGGTTTITATNVSTDGEPTGNPVPVVKVEGTTFAGAFTLARGPIAAGLYDYDLELQEGTQFVLVAGASGAGAAYEAAPMILAAFNRLPTLEQRVGGRAKRAGQAAWIRLHGDNSETSLTSGNSIDSSTWGFQVGADFDFEPGQNGRWVIGATGQYGDLSSTIAVSTSSGSGSIDTTGYGLGATATWYGNEGSYVDVQGQVNWLDSDLASSAAGSLVSGQSSTAYALSVEGGHRFALGQNAALIPQAQVTWGSVDGGSFTDSIGNAVNLGTNNSTIGRFGLAYEFNKNDVQKVYVIGNFLHDFSDDTAVSVEGGNNLTAAAASSTWAELGVGGSMAFGNMQGLRRNRLSHRSGRQPYRLRQGAERRTRAALQMVAAAAKRSTALPLGCPQQSRGGYLRLGVTLLCPLRRASFSTMTIKCWKLSQ